MAKRLFDFILSTIGILLLLPALITIALLVYFTSKGPVLYKQQRIGKNGKPFTLFKFRSMASGSDKKGLLTVGNKDARVTPLGYYLRKYKLDELPQLFNVWLGDMSLVGPRPEVEKYTSLYDSYQRKVLEVKPGITDYASLNYINENDILAKAEDPEKTYVEKIMPCKLRLNMIYINEVGLFTDIKIIGKTLIKIVTNGKKN